VTAAEHGNRQCAVARETDAGNDVGNIHALRDQQWPPVDATVPDAASGVEACIAAPDQRSSQRLAEFCDARRRRKCLFFPRQ
jgi:hypothetical protein